MKIIVKSSTDPRERNIEIKSTTWGELFEELSGDYKPANLEFFDNSLKKIYQDCEVLINGIQYNPLTDSLNTTVRDGDKVEVYIILVPGG